MIIKRIVVCWVALALAAISGVSVSAELKKPKPNAARTFFVTMQAGDEVTLATSGPLELFAECTNVGAFIRLNLLLTSSEGGWRNSVNSGSKPAGVLESVCVVFEDKAAFSDCSKSGTTAAAVSQSGHYLGLVGEATGVGVKIFGSDCLISGGVLTAKQ